jgi:preprotein translocase subunit SecE
VGTFFRELVHVGIYKRSQGRVTRQITFAALTAAIALGLLRLSSILMTSSLAEGAVVWFAAHPWLLPFYWLASACAWVAALPGFYLWFPLGVLLAAVAWTSYRLVNLPAFADFLIAVEAEMNKVSWPTRLELFRSSIVVLIMMFAFGLFLAGCDVFWKLLLSWGLGIL